VNIINVDVGFREPIRKAYPAYHKGPLIEDFAYPYFLHCQDINGWEYLPIAWTGWYCNNGFGGRTDGLRNYVKFLRLKERGTRIFTTVQCDIGTACDDILREQGVVVFGAGGVGDVPIPLLCSPHSVNKRPPRYLASFCGSFDTHPVRREMQRVMEGKPDVFLGRGGTSLFESVMSESTFALCPRGFGRTSFRLYEALQMGVVPVYIADDPWLPYWSEEEWSKFCILADSSFLPDLHKILSKIAENDTFMNSVREEISKRQHLFTLQGCCEWIEGKVRSL